MTRMLSVALLVLIAGCCAKAPNAPDDKAKASPATAPSQWTHELARDEIWYDHPAQARPPNGTWPSGTKVRMLQEAGSYAQVATEGGQTGYVASDALRKR